MKKKELRLQIELANDELIEVSKELYDTKNKLDNINTIVREQNNHIEMLNKQLNQQDKAIERKDKQFEGLKAAYKDDLINGLI